MRERDKDWWQQKTDEVSGFQQSSFYQSSTFDSRLPAGQVKKRPTRRKKAKRPYWLLFVVAGITGLVWVLTKMLSHWR
jgi:hypothetical protein